MPLSFTEAVGFLVRAIVQQAMGMPENSVRPANQVAPTGAADLEFATVFIPSMMATGQVEKAEEQIVDPDTDVVDMAHLRYIVDSLMSFSASVQFFKSPAATMDDVGLPKYSSAAFDKAVRLPQLLLMPPTLSLMNSYGIGYESAGSPQDLTALVDGVLYESRGQVDLHFNVVNREAMTVATYNHVNISLKVAQSSGFVKTTPITVEVPS